MSEATPDLSLADLERITGRTQGAAQCAYFKRLGIRYLPNPDGHPRVTWAVLDAYQLGSGKDAAWSPDFTHYRKAG